MRLFDTAVACLPTSLFFRLINESGNAASHTCVSFRVALPSFRLPSLAVVTATTMLQKIHDEFVAQRAAPVKPSEPF